jgi:hypothetical protein
MIQQFREVIDYFNQIVFSKLPSSAEVWILGGALRNFFMTGNLDNSNDIDLYFPDEANFNQICLFLGDQGELVFENDNSRRYELDSVPLDIDCVKMVHPTPTDTIKDIDFTINSILITRDKVYHHDTFFVDLASRKLILNRKIHLNNIFARIYRLIHAGFDISNTELKTIIDRQREIYNDHAKESKFRVAKFIDEVEETEFDAIMLETDDEVAMWLEMAYSQVCLDIYRHIETNGIVEPKIKAELIEHRGSMFQDDKTHFLEKRYPHGPTEAAETVYLNDQQEMFEFDETRYKQVSIKEEDAIYEP